MLDLSRIHVTAWEPTGEFIWNINVGGGEEMKETTTKVSNDANVDEEVIDLTAVSDEDVPHLQIIDAIALVSIRQVKI